MHLCSFGNDPIRSWTDVLTNHTFISSIDRRFDTNDLLEGRIPIYCMPQFLHEASHHWCLFSPVGVALTILDDRLRTSLDDTSPEGTALFLDNHFRIKTLITLYRPLLEGLALFTEFDAIPTHSEFLSMPMKLTLELFAREQVSDLSQKEMFDKFFLLVGGRRRGGDVIDRKTELLSSPLVSEEGYLAGYLFVKSIYLRATTTTRIGTDPDLVGGFLRHYFFSDYELVDLLLEPSPFAIIRTLPEYLITRLSSAYHISDLGQRLAEFEAAMLKQGENAVILGNIAQDTSAFDTDQKKSERGKTRLAEALEQPQAESASQLGLNVSRRSILHIVSYPVNIQIKDDICIASGENGPLWGGRTKEPWTGPIDNQGSVDFIYDTGFQVQGVAISIGPTIIGQLFSAEQDPLIEEQFANYVISGQILEAESDERIQRIRQRLEGTEDKDNLEFLLKQQVDFLLGTYADLGLAWVAKEKYDGCVEAMSRFGFLGIYDDEDAVKKLAVISMLDGMGAHLEEASIKSGTGDLYQDCQELENIAMATFGNSPFVRIREGDRDDNTGTRVVTYF